MATVRTCRRWGNQAPLCLGMLLVVAHIVALGGEVLGEDKADRASKVFAPDKLLKIDIRLDDKDWYSLRTSHRIPDIERIAEDPYKYYRAEVEIDGVKMGPVGVRKKGFFGSVISTRPSLKIRFDKWKKGQDFHGLDQLTLNNNNQDRSQINQYTAYWLFERAGVPAPRCNFALVTVNGQKLGVYCNVESIRRPFLKRHFQTSKGDLYEGYAGDFTDAGMKRIVYKNGKPHSHRKPLKRLKKILEDPDCELRAIEKRVDLTAFIKFWATEVLIGHWDSYSGNRNNYYLYRLPDSKKFHFLPWGADAIFTDPGPFARETVPKSVKCYGALCGRLWKFPEVRKRYRKEMLRLLAEVWNEKEILAEMARVSRLLKPHVPASALGSMQLKMAKAFVAQRRRDVERELAGSPPDWTAAALEMPSDNDGRMKIVGSFDTKMRKRDPANPVGVGKGTLEVQLGADKKMTLKPVAVYAIPESPISVRPKYPVVRMIALDEDKKTWVLELCFDPIRMPVERPRLTVDHFCVWAIVIKGDPDPMSPTASRKVFGILGSVDLKQFHSEPGGAVSGSFELNTSAFDKPPRRKK